MLRWLGASLVVLCSSLLSMNAVLRSWQRIRALRVLAEAIQAMRLELEEHRLPLPSLLERLGSSQRQPAAELFSTAAVHMSRRDLPFSSAWEMALRETESLSLRPEELQVMENLGRQLGKSNTGNQTEIILKTEKKLALFLELEEKERLKHNRLRAAAGVCAGLVLAILLL